MQHICLYRPHIPHQLLYACARRSSESAPSDLSEPPPPLTTSLSGAPAASCASTYPRALSVSCPVLASGAHPDHGGMENRCVLAPVQSEDCREPRQEACWCSLLPGAVVGGTSRFRSASFDGGRPPLTPLTPPEPPAAPPRMPSKMPIAAPTMAAGSPGVDGRSTVLVSLASFSNAETYCSATRSVTASRPPSTFSASATCFLGRAVNSRPKKGAGQTEQGRRAPEGGRNRRVEGGA